MKTYTAHSVKRGAISTLLELLASGCDLKEELISRLAKHFIDVGDLKYNNKIRRERNRHRSGPEDILSDEVPIKLIRKMGAQFTHRAKSTRIPSTSYEKSAPFSDRTADGYSNNQRPDASERPRAFQRDLGLDI